MFKIERTASGERVAYVRLFAGTLRPRQRVRVGGGEEAKPTSIKVFAPAGAPRRDVAHGRRDGDRPRARRRPGRRRDRRAAAGRGRRPRASRGRRSRPSCSPLRPEQQGSLRAALAQLAEQDPLIDVRQDDHRHEIAVSLYGEVQKEVIQATLERDYGIAADFRETTTVCIERPAGVGEAEEVIRAKTHTNITGRSSPLSTNPFMATLALRIEPAPVGSGIEFRADVEPRLVPLYLFKTPDVFVTQMEAFVREALAEGLAGWQVTDCRVTMTDCGYASPDTSAADFRRLTQLVLMTALDRAGTWVCEPLARPRPRDAGVDRAGRPRARSAGSAAASRGQFSANGVSKVGAVLPVARVRVAPAPAARPVDGGGDPRVAPRRLPAGRRRQPAATRPARARARSTGTPGSRRSRSEGNRRRQTRRRSCQDQGSATRCQETVASVGTSSGVTTPLSMSITNQPSSAAARVRTAEDLGAVRRERQIRTVHVEIQRRSKVVFLDRQRTRTRDRRRRPPPSGRPD